nr:uncharacterized mitochondrial protein AtMg00810-like [Tanacetum cinerariifolium]
MEKSSNPLVLQVSETSKKDLEDLFQNFYDEYFDSSKIMKSSTTNVETSNVKIPSHEEEVFHESSESFQEESSSSSLNDGVQQSPEEFGMENCDTIPTPVVKQAKLRLDLARKQLIILIIEENPNEHHVSAVKRIFRYVKRTINLGLWYPKDSGFDLSAYSDADHARCHLDRKSTSGSVQFLGDKLVCWSSKKQNYVSISKAESEYVAVSSCCAQVLWMRT